jgi:hypothetical protein
VAEADTVVAADVQMAVMETAVSAGQEKLDMAMNVVFERWLWC